VHAAELCLSRSIDRAAADVFGLILPHDLKRNRFKQQQLGLFGQRGLSPSGFMSSQRLSALTLLRGLSAIWQRA